MIDETGATTQGATASSFHDQELSSLLGRENAALEHTLDPISLEAECFPLDGVIDAAPGSVRAESGAMRTRSTQLAREVLARAEDEVRDLLAQDPLAADWTDRSGDIVARAQRQVREILARGRSDAEVLELRAEADLLADNHIDSNGTKQATSSTLIRPDLGRWPSAHAIVEEGPSTAATDQAFATLRAVVLPSEAGVLRYRVSGHLTLATMLAFQYAVSRLPGVDSARVDPEPNDVAVLSLMTNDSTLVHRQLERISGVHLHMDLA